MSTISATAQDLNAALHTALFFNQGEALKAIQAAIDKETAPLREEAVSLKALVNARQQDVAAQQHQINTLTKELEIARQKLAAAAPPPTPPPAPES